MKQLDPTNLATLQNGDTTILFAHEFFWLTVEGLRLKQDTV